MHGFALHLLQKRLRTHRFRHEHGGAGDLGHRHPAPRGLVAEGELHQVLQVHDAGDVVSLAVGDRNAGDALVEEQRHRLLGGRRGIHRHHVGTRDHDGAHEPVGEIEDGVDEVAVVRLDQVLGCRFVHHAEQLLLRGEGRVPVDAGRQPIADEDEKVRQRPQHDARAADQGGACSEEALRVLPADGSRRCTHQHERRDRHDDDRGEHGPPDVVEDEGEGHRDEDRRGGLHEDADEDDGGAVGVGVGRDPQQRRRATAVLAESLEVGPRRHVERGLERGHESAEGDQEDGGDEEEDLGHARRRRSLARNDAMSSFCRPNISRSSSGSA